MINILYRNKIYPIVFDEVYNQIYQQYPQLEKNYINNKRDEAEKRTMITNPDEIVKTEDDKIHEYVFKKEFNIFLLRFLK